MKIVLELTAEQVTSIMTQVAMSFGDTKAVAPVMTGNLALKIREVILALPSERVFNPSTLMLENGIKPDAGFSNAVKPLIASGSCKMIQKGTWKRL